MKYYLDEIYTVSEFKRDNPALTEQAERAIQYLKGYCHNLRSHRSRSLQMRRLSYRRVQPLCSGRNDSAV